MIKITLFSQILQHIDRTIFKKIVRKHQTDKYSKGIDSWTHFVSMLFMHLADATSVRDISNGLRSATGDLNHLGIKKPPSKSSISYINAHRDYKIFEEYFYALLEKLEPSLKRRRQYATRLKRKIYIMDGSVIPLCLSLFDWAKYKTTKGGIKLHTVLDYDTGLPCYATITDAKRHEVNEAREIAFPSGSIVVMDRGYVDYKWLFNLDSCGVHFVTRLNINIWNPKIGLIPKFKDGSNSSFCTVIAEFHSENGIYNGIFIRDTSEHFYLELTRFDTIDRIISGLLECTLIQNDGGIDTTKIKVTDGVFDARY